ncbi:aspartate/glutamate racemase family protein [Bacillus safensis]|uniref:aspartate/glutamate racemase family protein n=1 Tax=Bacillus safensis TaxID=561879 RepID=UPI000909A535|nr:amino acid racemase [Bacillus safensis]APJ10528.1 aspartate racemase [Bacillus safensis]
MSTTIGIMGGMGPLATIDLMKKIISHTPAIKDQDHLHVIADNYPQIPDRTNAIFVKGEDPTEYMIASAKRLERAGADFILIACNTAHFFLENVQQSTHIPIMNMPLETAKHLNKHHYTSVGLLCTDGTLKTKLYQKACAHHKIDVMTPSEELQKNVMNGIYAVKAGKLSKGESELALASEILINQGAEAIIAGCTEIPLVLRSTNAVKVIDPTVILAKEAVKLVYELEKLNI